MKKSCLFILFWILLIQNTSYVYATSIYNGTYTGNAVTTQSTNSFCDYGDTTGVTLELKDGVITGQASHWTGLFSLTGSIEDDGSTTVTSGGGGFNVTYRGFINDNTMSGYWEALSGSCSGTFSVTNSNPIVTENEEDPEPGVLEENLLNMKTGYHQREPYSKYTPDNKLVGCGPLAMGRIFAYYQQQYQTDDDLFAKLVAQIGQETNAEYGFKLTTIESQDFIKFAENKLNSIGFKPDIFQFGSIKEGKRERISEFYIWLYQKIDKNIPIFIGSDSGEHAFVVDGYKRENPLFGKEDLYLHILWGWGERDAEWVQIDAGIWDFLNTDLPGEKYFDNFTNEDLIAVALEPPSSVWNYFVPLSCQGLSDLTCNSYYADVHKLLDLVQTKYTVLFPSGGEIFSSDGYWVKHYLPEELYIGFKDRKAYGYGGSFGRDGITEFGDINRLLNQLEGN